MSTNYPVYPYYGTDIPCNERPIAIAPQCQNRQLGVEWAMEPLLEASNACCDELKMTHSSMNLHTL